MLWQSGCAALTSRLPYPRVLPKYKALNTHVRIQVGDKIDYIKVLKIDGDFINGPDKKSVAAPALKAKEPAGAAVAAEAVPAQ